MNQEVTLKNTALSVGSLGSYVHWAQQFPMLTQAEETELANRLFKNNDLQAAQQLILSHIRFVIRVARGYEGYGLAVADLIQEGNIGLMKAVRRFNPDMGVRLVSFAIHWIRAEMHEFIIRNWRIVKIATTKAQRKLFFNLRKSSKKLGYFSNSEVTAIAEELKVSEKDVRKMEMRLSSVDESLNISQSDDDFSYTMQSYLTDPDSNPATQLEYNDWQNSQYAHLHESLKDLDERSRDIIYHRWLGSEKITLQDLAKKYNVSAERVRQLEKNAFNKIRVHLEAENM